MEIVTANIDEALIKRAQNGDENAFRQLVVRHQEAIHRTVLGMLGPSAEVEDVVQEVFIRFYKAMAKFEGKAKLSTYLTRIAINLSLNEIARRKKQFKWLPILGRKEHFDESNDSVSDVVDPHASLDRFDDADEIKQALWQLPENFRTVLVLRLIDGYSVQETADLLGLPKGTIASRLMRAQQKMMDLLKD